MYTNPLLLFLLLTVTHASNISTTGACGPLSNLTCLSSSFGSCCSPSSFCGSNATYCGAGCQTTFGACYLNSTHISPASDGTCGAASTNQYTCLGSVFGNCCSGHGFCGGNDTYCGSGSGCQGGYGVCGSGSEAAGVSVATTVVGGVATSSASAEVGGMATSSASASAEVGGVATSSTSAEVGGVATGSASAEVGGSGSGGLSGGAKAGIGVGVAVVASLIIGAVVFFVLKRRRGRTASVPFQAEMSAAGSGKEKQTHDGKVAPSEMGTEGAVGEHLVELPTSRSHAELPTSSSHAELPARAMTEKERIARVDDRVAAGYDGAYRGN